MAPKMQRHGPKDANTVREGVETTLSVASDESAAPYRPKSRRPC